MQILLLSQDLLLTSQLEGVARNLGGSLVRCADSQAAREHLAGGQLIVVDLGVPGLELAALVQRAHAQEPRVPVVACGPHVHASRLAAARTAGCDRVVSRGQWSRAAESLCQELLGGRH